MLSSEGFDLWADGYDGDVNATDDRGDYPFAGYREVLYRVCRAVREAVPKGGRVLDVGFGTGTLLHRLYQDGYHITGLDFSREMARIAGEKCPGATLIQHDFTKGWPKALHGETFDAIISTYALHHLKEEEQVDFLRLLFGRLRPGGVLALGDVSFRREKDRQQVRKAAGDEWDDGEHYYCWEARKEGLTLPFAYEQLSICAGVLTLRKPRMMLLDFGGTLAEEGPFDALAAMEALMAHAVTNRDGLANEELSAFAQAHFRSLETVRQSHLVEVHNHGYLRFVYEYLGITFAISPVEQELHFWQGGGGPTPKKGAAALLRALAGQGIQTGVISNIMYSEAALAAQLARLFPGHGFAFIIASSEYMYRKPSPHLFNLALKKAGLSPQEVWYMGDRMDCDVEGPAALSIPALWVRDGRDPMPLPEGCAAVDDLRQLTACFPSITMA